MAQRDPDFIEKATAQHKGLFARKAKAAGMSTRDYAKANANAPGTLGKEARLAQTLMNMNHKGKK